MDIHFKQKNDVCVVTIEGELLVSNSRAVSGLIREKGRDYSAYAVDLSGVTAIDTAGIQLLMHLKKDFAARNKAFKLIGHSVPVISFFDLYGLAPFFGDKIHIKSSDKKNYAFCYGVRKSEADESYLTSEP